MASRKTRRWLHDVNLPSTVNSTGVSVFGGTRLRHDGCDFVVNPCPICVFDAECGGGRGDVLWANSDGLFERSKFCCHD